MNKLRMIFLLSIVALVLVSIGLVSAQTTTGNPPTPQMIEEIRETRGTALLKYYPQYAQILIPVVGGVSTVRHPNAPSADWIREIRETRCAAR